MRFLQTLLITLLFSMGICAQEWNDNEYKQIENSVVQPKFAERNFVITKYGASVKASADVNQKAINKAIAICSMAGGGKVIIPEGTWNTGAITLKSHVNLVVEKGATLLFAFDTKLYPIVKTRWEGLDCMNYQPCIYAYQATDIAITGEGTIDGNGSWNTWWRMCAKGDLANDKKIVETQRIGRPQLSKMAEDGVPIEQRNMGGKGMRPQLINFYQCEGILIESVTLLRSPFWVIHYIIYN